MERINDQTLFFIRMRGSGVDRAWRFGQGRGSLGDWSPPTGSRCGHGERTPQAER